MADKFTAEKRSNIMSKVRSANTTPEIRVRKLLHRMGYRFRLHQTDLPGKPDIVLRKYKTVIFVHGCFWHGCPICRHAKIRPATNAEYWNKKLDRTIERDKENQRKLKEMGWCVMVIWECETKKKVNEQLIQKLQSIMMVQSANQATVNGD
jgi:DNA mismatch endonuclease (patch repair protein)